jgi:hypothetical protein
VWVVCYFSEKVRHISAPNPSNTLLIRKGVDLRRKTVIEAG